MQARYANRSLIGGCALKFAGIAVETGCASESKAAIRIAIGIESSPEGRVFSTCGRSGNSRESEFVRDATVIGRLASPSGRVCCRVSGARRRGSLLESGECEAGGSTTLGSAKATAFCCAPRSTSRPNNPKSRIDQEYAFVPILTQRIVFGRWFEFKIAVRGARHMVWRGTVRLLRQAPSIAESLPCDGR